jgi:hypothetical protein
MLSFKGTFASIGIPQTHHHAMACCRFFKRYNKVVLDVAAVDRERGRLEQENADLRQLLKSFLDGIRCAVVQSAKL